jgi:hypothetical protein
MNGELSRRATVNPFGQLKVETVIDNDAAHAVLSK